MSRTGERIMDVALNGAVHIARFALDLTDYLEPRIREIQGQGEIATMLRNGGWKEINFGPLSETSLAAPLVLDKILKDVESGRSSVFRFRQRVDNLLRRRR